MRGESVDIMSASLVSACKVLFYLFSIPIIATTPLWDTDTTIFSTFVSAVVRGSPEREGPSPLHLHVLCVGLAREGWPHTDASSCVCVRWCSCPLYDLPASLVFVRDLCHMPLNLHA